MKKIYTVEEWISEGEQLFGSDQIDWVFQCPSCGHIQEGRERAFHPRSSAFICFTCLSPKQPGKCDKTAKTMDSNPVQVIHPGGIMRVFPFAR